MNSIYRGDNIYKGLGLEGEESWEEVPEEDLWEDGHLSSNDVKAKISMNMHLGKYLLIRRIDANQKK